jgi:hypothetical protein
VTLNKVVSAKLKANPEGGGEEAAVVAAKRRLGHEVTGVYLEEQIKGCQNPARKHTGELFVHYIATK